MDFLFYTRVVWEQHQSLHVVWPFHVQKLHTFIVSAFKSSLSNWFINGQPDCYYQDLISKNHLYLWFICSQLIDLYRVFYMQWNHAVIFCNFLKKKVFLFILFSLIIIFSTRRLIGHQKNLAESKYWSHFLSQVIMEYSFTPLASQGSWNLSQVTMGAMWGMQGRIHPGQLWYLSLLIGIPEKTRHHCKMPIIVIVNAVIS